MIDNNNTSAAGDLTRRMVDEFFRRIIWYLLPIVLFTGIGFMMATRPSIEYTSSGTLAVSRNPLVDEVDARGTSIDLWETPSSGTARLVNEQLSTDAFISDIAQRAGLQDAIDSGLLSTEIIRNQISATELGQNSIRVSATWSDGETVQLLVQTTIDAYRDYVTELVATDSTDAIEFWTERRDEARLVADEAEQTLSDYIDSLPRLRADEEDYPLSDRLEMGRLSDKYDSALAIVNDAQTRIDDAALNMRQVQSEAGRQILVIDAPEVPLAPESSVIRRAITAAMMIFVGILVSLTALVVTTLLDRTIRSRAQLAAVVGTSATAAVPRIKPSAAKRRERRSEKKDAA